MRPIGSCVIIVTDTYIKVNYFMRTYKGSFYGI